MAVEAVSSRMTLIAWRNRLVARPGFQAWASRLPILRRFARRDAMELFDLVQGFVRSQVLFALVETDIPQSLMRAPSRAEDLAPMLGLSERRTAQLLQAGAGIGLLRRGRDGRFSLTRQGAALEGVPGLKAMIRHHAAFYRDMADPVALLKDNADTELARIWPYVLSPQAAAEPDPTTAHYSELMAASAAMVARDTLDTLSLKGVSHLLDIGGGSGMFVKEVAAQYPDMALGLFDLPGVMEIARASMCQAGLTDRVALHPGSFRDDPLPEGAQAISLIRVLYDHDDATVRALLAKCRAALPQGGRLIISEPMSGGDRPDAVTDVYFAFYTMAMRTGCTRSAQEIATLCREAGFERVVCHTPRRSFVTSVVSAQTPLR